MKIIFAGGLGSGNFGHEGRPGEVGGSSESWFRVNSFLDGFGEATQKEKELWLELENEFNPLSGDAQFVRLTLSGRTEYNRIQEYLRGKVPASNFPLVVKQKLDEIVHRMSRIFSEHSLPKDTYLYRGTNFEFEVGNKFVDKGFIFTTTSQDLAMFHVGRRTREKNGLFRIRAPKGTPYAIGDSLEWEVLFKPGTKFEIKTKSQPIKMQHPDGIARSVILYDVEVLNEN